MSYYNLYKIASALTQLQTNVLLDPLICSAGLPQAWVEAVRPLLQCVPLQSFRLSDQ